MKARKKWKAGKNQRHEGTQARETHEHVKHVGT